MELRGTFICISKKHKENGKWSYRFVADNGQQIILHTQEEVDVELYTPGEYSFLARFIRGMDRNTLFVAGEIIPIGEAENKNGSKSGIFSF